MAINAINISGLKKTYAGGKNTAPKEALKGIDLTIPRGSFFALLGPNGAGKSTTINIMAGLVQKSAGTVEICGHDIDKEMRAARRSIGIVPQELVLDTFFTVRQALDIYAGFYGVPKHQRRTDEIIHAMGLSAQADINSRRLSGGMRRRLLIAKSLVHSPEVLVLDEPTAGVDVELRQQLWDYVKKLNAAGTTILLTTHYLEEAETLCDEIAIINHGNLIAHEKKEKLMRSFDCKDLIITPAEMPSALPASLSEMGATLGKDNIHISYKPSKTQVEDILRRVQSAGISIRDLKTQEPALEEIFRNLTSAKAA